MSYTVGQPVWAYSRAIRADIPAVIESIKPLADTGYGVYTVTTKDERIDGGKTDVLRDDLQPVTCEWFAMCDHTATHFQSHPVIGDVPICDRCQGVYDRA